MATQVWAWQGGSSDEDGFYAVAMGSDGSSVSAGNMDEGLGPGDSFFAAVKLDANGTVLWKWENTSIPEEFNPDELIINAPDRIDAAAMGQDGSIVLAGVGSSTNHVIKLDADGSFVWHVEVPRELSDNARGITMGDDGSVVVVGSHSSTGTSSMTAFNLDADGILVWIWQNATVESTSANAVAMAEDGSVVIVGHSDGQFGAIADPSFVTSDVKFAAIKLDSGGAEVWRWQDGAFSYDSLNAVSVTEDGCFVMAGYTTGTWSGLASAGGQDFAAVKLDADGNEVWRWQDGTTENETMAAMVVLDDGTVVLGGYTRGDWSDSNTGANDFAVVALDADGEEIWRWQGGSTASDDSTADDYLYAMAAGSDGRLILAGETNGSWVDTKLGYTDQVAVMLDTGPLATASPTVAPSPAVAKTPSPALPTESSPAAAPSSPPAPTPAPNTTPTTLTTSPAPTPAPSSAVVSATPPGPTPSASNSMPIVAGVASAVAGAALIALGLCLRKRQLARRNGTTEYVLPPVIVVEERSDRPPLQHNLAPLHPPYPPTLVAGAASAASVIDGGGGGIVSPFPKAFAGAVQPEARPTTHAAKDGDGDGTGGFSLAKVDSELPPHAETHGGGGGGGGGGVGVGGGRGDGAGGCVIAIAGGGIEPTTQPVNGGGGGDSGGASLGQGYTEPSTHAGIGGGDGGSGGGGGISIGHGDTEPMTHGGEDGGRGVAIREGDREPTSRADKSGGGGVGVGGGGGGGAVLAEGNEEDGSAEPALAVTTSTANVSTEERDEITQAYRGGGMAGAALVADEPKPSLDEMGASSSTDRSGLGRAVGEAALEMARSSQIPGVSEAAVAVSILVNLVTNNRDNKKATEASLKRCRSLVTMLQRASTVLGKGGDTTGRAERAMMEDVHDAISDLVELVKTYQSKNRLSQLLMSTLFRRRQDEMEAVVDRAILGLHLGLQVQVGSDVSAVKEGMHLHQGSIAEATSECLAKARRARRQRKLDKLEIPEDHVSITDELLGKGGFGEVYLADYSGRNAAAKVLQVEYNAARRGENYVLDGSKGGQLNERRKANLRKAFLRELEAMIRLRSPYTVNVYGAVTAVQDRLILVMELLAGGDLRMLLKTADQPLPEKQSRQIIGDICAGMVFLHGKETVHGDLKSANVLLDGAGRAKIGDFGTSRWTQHTMSTGLATFTTNSSQNTQMSLAWSAPEVLEEPGSTYASDVYSFGIVVWEVLSRELPWSTEAHPRDIYIRVALKGQRPVIPDDAPDKIAKVARACWAVTPGDRPTFTAILHGMKSNGWNE